MADTVIQSLNGASMSVSGNYLYLLTTGQLNIYNVSNPANTTLVGSVSLNGSYTGSSITSNLAIVGNYAYVVSTGPDLYVVNITNPTDPTISSTTTAHLTSPVAISVINGDAYISDFSGNDIAIFNVNNPASPTYVTSLSTGASSNPAGSAIEGQYLYVAESGTNAISVINISNPASPSITGTISGVTSYPNNVAVNGLYLYVNGYNGNNFQIYYLGGTYTQSLQAGATETSTLQVDQNANITGNESINGGIAVAGNAELGANLGLIGGATIQGSTILSGGTNQLAVPAAPTVTPTGTTGSTSYSYTVAAVNAYGGETPASSAGSTTTGNATLSYGNYNAISWSSVSGASSYDIYRTVGGGTTGLIGTSNTTTFNDIGFSGSGTSSPVFNTTNQLNVSGSALIATPTNTTTAFQIQNSSGASVLNQSTTSFSGISGDVSSWSNSPNQLPQELDHNASVTYNGYLYSIGGWNGTTAVANVYYASLNSNGSVNAWSSTTSLTSGGAALDYISAFAYNGYMYVIGGSTSTNNCGSGVTTVYYDTINGGGTLGATWSSTSTLLQSLCGGSIVVNNGYVYYFGGNHSSSPVANVEKAAINVGGTLGAWAYSTALPQSIDVESSVTYNNYVYILGGYNGSSVLNTVYYTTINGATLGGTWTTSPITLPLDLGWSTADVNNGYVYIFGGSSDSYDINSVYYTSFNSNGSINNWTTSSSVIPTSISSSSSSVNNNYVYLVGGYDNNTGVHFSNVYYSSLPTITTLGQGTTTLNSALSTTSTVNIQNTANSNSEFNINDSVGANVLNVSTSTNTLNLNGNINLVQTNGPTTAPSGTIASGSGLNVTGGGDPYQYVVSYVTASGQTNAGPSSSGITTTSGNQAIDLSNIPISPSPLVIGRDVYRTTSSENWLYYFVTYIPDNTTTTYVDNIPDSQLGYIAPGTNQSANFQVNGSTILISDPNSDSVGLGQGAIASNQSYNNTGIGINALTGTESGYDNTAVGASALASGYSGYQNAALGVNALESNNNDQNAAVGVNALQDNWYGQNSALGYSALGNSTFSGGDTAVGWEALNSLTTGSGDTSLGSGSDVLSSGLSNSTAIGISAAIGSSDSIILGAINGVNGATNSTNVGIGTTNPENLLSVSSAAYSAGTAGTAGVSSTTVTGSGTTWTSALIGDQIVFSDGQSANITAVGTTISLTINSAVTESAGTSYHIYFPALQVTTAGKVGLGNVSPSYALD
ncbi:MAG: beta strand repeat-containing protein, partial [Candidatus Saccharimonadales bacterium]